MPSNDTSNLRLVSRAANASHEFELSGQGQYQEALKEMPEQPGEFRNFLVPGAMSAADQQALTDAIKAFVGKGSAQGRGVIHNSRPAA